MANPDAPFGMRPVRHINGSSWNGATIKCAVSASYATALFVGDPVDIDTTLTDYPTAPRMQYVIRAGMADTNPTLGVITAIEPIPTNLTLKHIPASTGGYVYVCVDPTVVYWVRGDAAGIPINSCIFSNATGTFTSTGSTYTGLSGFELVEAAGGTANSSYPLLIVGVADTEDNAFDGTADTHIIWEVILSTARLAGSSGTDYGALGVVAS